MSHKIKVCSFNLRIRTEVDGINCFDNRIVRIGEVIKEEAPALIGFQESSEYMVDRLMPYLEDYTVLYCGRDEHCLGEAAVIAVSKREFAVVSYDNFWLSYTPDVPGSRYTNSDQSTCPRITACALLYHRESGKRLRFCNTHLDHKGENARLLGMAQICQYLSRFSEPFVLTGDFNAKPDSPVIDLIGGFSHCGKATKDATREISGTFHGFGTRKALTKIDYIFTDAECDVSESYAVAKEPIDGVYVSDHHPIVAYIQL